MIQAAVGVHPDEIFISSDPGSGIPAGNNFVDYIRSQMRDATFVVAVISPAYKESEFCLAELGAVWLKADRDFFPLCTPAIDRGGLEATLTGIQVARIEERASLAQLLQRLCAHFEREHNAGACTTAIEVFLSTAQGRLDALRGPTKVPAEELEQARAATRELGEQLNAARDELASERKRYEDLKLAKTQEEIDAIELPEDEIEQVKYLRREVLHAMIGLGSNVKKVLPFSVNGGGMPWPQGGWERDDLQTEVDNGYLRDGEDGFVYLNKDWPDINAASAATKMLQECLEGLSDDARRWFVREYRVPPDLSQSAAFSALF